MRLLFAMLGCSSAPDGCENPGTEGATARCLEPTLDPQHYVDEALAYFDTLDVDAPRDSVPDYHPQVARWEWPPWLYLTGYEADSMNASAALLRLGDPSTVPVRDCRFFDVQPFARCFITFEYEGGSCPIYEEFVFDAQGRTTFIEAWSDLPGLRPHADIDDDPWGEDDDLGRLSTRIPGLGQPSGTHDLDGAWFAEAAAADPDVAEFQRRARDAWPIWFDELENADPDFFAIGCGWSIERE